MNRTFLEDEDRLETVLKSFTHDDTCTFKDRDPLALFAAAMVAASTVAALVTDQIWKEACLKQLGPMKQNEIFSLVRLPDGKKAVGLRWVFSMKDGPTSQFAKAELIVHAYT